jgi:hypothetical protein
MRALIPLLVFASSAPLLAQPTEVSLKTSHPAARQLFERDWVLMNWALKSFDLNRDVLLQPDEAAAAAAAFRKLADSDQDGRVTTDEYRSAREAILSGG